MRYCVAGQARYKPWKANVSLGLRRVSSGPAYGHSPACPRMDWCRQRGGSTKRGDEAMAAAKPVAT